VEKIREEIRRLVPPYAQMTADGRSWLNISSPMAAFHAEGADKKISFSPVVSIAGQQDNAGYPFTAILGTVRCHLGSGTRTNASARIRDFDLSGEVAICAADADRLQLKDGDTVKVESRWGAIKREVGRSDRIAPGQLFVPLAVNANDAMNLIDLSDPADPKSAGWKSCAVKIKKA
jgi:anaerobic selenocysteine-containing dehydrogenase